MGLRMKTFKYYWISLKNLIFKEEGFTKNEYIGENSMKTGVETVWRFKREVDEKDGSEIFKWGLKVL